MNEEIYEDDKLALLNAEANELQSDIDHTESFIEGFESIVNKFKENTKIEISGCECYTVGVLKANGIRFHDTMGSENFITEGVKKLYEMIVNLIKKIKDFFFGKSAKPVNQEKLLKMEKEVEEKREKMIKDVERGVVNDQILNSEYTTVNLDIVYSVFEGKRKVENVPNVEESVLDTLFGGHDSPVKGTGNKVFAKSFNKIVRKNPGILTKAKGMDVKKVVERHIKYVKTPEGEMDAEKIQKEKFNKAIENKINSLETYLKDNQYKDMSIIGKIKNSPDKELEKETKELERLEQKIKSSTVDDETIKMARDKTRIVKTLAEINAINIERAKRVCSVSDQVSGIMLDKVLFIIVECIKAESKH